jgi:hypothetical protein
MANNNLTPPLQDALEDASLLCVALQGQVFALGQAYAHGDSMNEELFQAFMWGIDRGLESIKKTIERVPYQREEVNSQKMKHAATIPMVAIEAHCKKRGMTVDEWMKNPSAICETLTDQGMAEHLASDRVM